MRHLTPRGTKRAARLLGAAALLIAATGAPSLLAASPAGAATCASGTPTTTNCSKTATATLTGGTLSLAATGVLGWSTTLTGLAQNVVDTTAGDQTYTVDDARGSGAGWNVTADATTFTTGGGTPSTLPNSGTFSTNGSLTSVTGTTAPTSACSSGATGCTVPSNSIGFPVAITTAASSPTPVAIYNAATSSGLGSIDIGAGGSPVGWWIALPPTTAAGTYTSTVTLTIASGP